MLYFQDKQWSGEYDNMKEMTRELFECPSYLKETITDVFVCWCNDRDCHIRGTKPESPVFYGA